MWYDEILSVQFTWYILNIITSASGEIMCVYLYVCSIICLFHSKHQYSKSIYLYSIYKHMLDVTYSGGSMMTLNQ